MRTAALLAALLAAAPAAAGTLRVEAYGRDGLRLDGEALRALLDPGRASATSGLRVSGPDGAALDGRPWWVASSTEPAWSWEGSSRAFLSVPWPVPEDGYSTVRLDSGGQGYEDGRTILLNEEAARWAYGALQDSLKDRTASPAWKPAYAPSRKARGLVSEAKAAVARATAAADRRERARLFDEALRAVSVAWQQVLVEHGRQTSADPARRKTLRWGLSLDESAAVLPRGSAALAKDLGDSGADWVRVVFGVPQGDPAFAREESFGPYDELLRNVSASSVSVMGSLLDSQLWPPGTTPELCAERARRLVARYKDRVRSWETASEPNGTWLGGRRPVADEDILACDAAMLAEVKKADPALEAVATLHWWDGTAPDGRHGLRDWLAWALPKGFGQGLDAVALSLYPHRHPVGLSLEPAFRELAAAFPGKPVLLGGWSYGEGGEAPAYWWLAPEPAALDGARKDLMMLYGAASPALTPESRGGGFYWQTLELLLPDQRQPTPLFRLYRKSLHDLRR